MSAKEDDDGFKSVSGKRGWKQRPNLGETNDMSDEPDLQEARAKQVKVNKLCIPRASSSATSSKPTVFSSPLMQEKEQTDDNI